MKKTFFLLLMLCAVSMNAQTNEFTYQGKLHEAGLPANGIYDMQFQLYAVISGSQTAVGTPVERPGVTVANGTFTVTLDFSHVSGSFTGSDRFLGISVRLSGSGAPFTSLNPTQKFTSSPYAIRSQTSQSASTAGNSAQLGGVAANQYVITSDPRMSDARTPLAGSGDYIQNSTAAQASSNFNISGNGTAAGTLSGNIVNATAGFDIASTRVLSVRGTNNTLVGENAGGSVLSTGSNNTMVGFAAGDVLSSGGYNSFVGSSAGAANTTGAANSFFGALAGNSNTSGLQNSFFGRGAGAANTTAGGNSYFGAYSGNVSTGADNSFFGSMTGLANSTGFNNSFFGSDAGRSNTTASGNSFFGYSSGTATTSGGSNSFFGNESGVSNTSGTANSFFGAGTGRMNILGQWNSFFGTGAGRENTLGHRNSFFGYTAGRQNTDGDSNSFFGDEAGFNNTGGQYNTYLGAESGKSNTIGGYNVAIGYRSGSGGGATGQNNVQIGRNTRVWLEGSNNTVLGANASIEPNSAQDGTPSSLSYATAIGAEAKAFYHNSIWLGRETGEDTVFIPGTVRASTTVFTPLLIADRADISTSLRVPLFGIGTDSVCRSNTGYLAVCFSSLSYKTNVTTFTGGLDLVRRLRPIAFNWTEGGMRDLGFGAEEVEAVEPLLVRHGEDGQVQGVKYDRVGAVLVNAVNEQQAQIDALKAQIEQQKLLIQGLKRAVCAQKSKAPVCKERGNE